MSDNMIPDNLDAEVSNSVPDGDVAADWKRELKTALNQLVDTLPDAPSLSANDVADSFSTGPTLEDFYRSLIALEANTRKNVQKTNTVLESVSSALRGLQVQFSSVEEQINSRSGEDSVPVIELNGQFLRLLNSLQSAPAPLPFGLSRNWEKAWNDLCSGVEIIHRSVVKLLNDRGIQIEAPDVGSAFDPFTMEAVKVTSSENGEGEASVAAVIEPAYFQNNTLVRAARVHVSK